MKKLLLLCGIVMCCLSSYASIVLSVSPSTVNGPTATVTVTAVGETSSEHITDVPNTTYSVSVSPSGNAATGDATSVNYYNATTGSPTSFTFDVSCSNTTASTVTYYMYLTTRNASGVIVNQMAYPFTVNVNAVASCTGALTSTSIDGVTFTGSRTISVGYHTLSVTYSGTPQRLVFINNTQYASISSQIPTGYPNTPSGGTGSCYFYYIGGGTAIIAINVTDSCGTLHINNVSFN